MAEPLKICAGCMEFLRESEDGQQDLGSFLMSIGAGGIEMVPAERCEARFTGHSGASPAIVTASRSLADVAPEELDHAITWFLKQLRLPSQREGEGWDLGNAIKAEWLKALEIRQHENPDLPS
jgi:hypothetical protein